MKELTKEILSVENKSTTYLQNLCQGYILTADFLREYQDKLNWHTVTLYQDLSEELILEFQDKVNWEMISAYYDLSEDFIRKFEDKLDYYPGILTKPNLKEYSSSIQLMILYHVIPHVSKTNRDLTPFMRDNYDKIKMMV
jgi:hypothetical protein